MLFEHIIRSQSYYPPQALQLSMNFNISELVYSMSAIKKYFNDCYEDYSRAAFSRSEIWTKNSYFFSLLLLFFFVFVIQLLLNLYFVFETSIS